MNSETFVKKAKDIALNYQTIYIMGCFGSPLNNENKKRYVKNYFYNSSRLRKEKILNASNDTFGFDCVCLIKGILWGWNGNKEMTYGGAKYKSNSVPDVSADGIINYCIDVSSDFTKIESGELVYTPGHVGIYIGEGLVVECTPIWKDGVQITCVSNIGKKGGYKCRNWSKHGKLKFINYENVKNELQDIIDIAYQVIDGKWGNNPIRKQKLIDAGYDYDKVQNEVNRILSLNNNIYYPIPDYNGVSIVDALKQINVDSSITNRKKIALKNGFINYNGTETENIRLLNLLKNGSLKK